MTLILPIRNEETFIQRCFSAVLAQDYPTDRLEILVVDGMSDDATLDIIKQLPDVGRVRIIPNPRRIKAAALNLAIPQAHGDYIFCVDGHTIIAPDYVRQCLKVLGETGAWNVGGPVNPVGTSLISSAIAAATQSVFAIPSAFRVSQQAQYTDTVYPGAWPRSVFERLGSYSEDVGVNDDYEFNYRIRQAGGRIFFSPVIQSQYFGSQTLSALARQYLRYGRSKAQTVLKYPGSLRLRHVIAPSFIIYLLVGIVLILLRSLLIGFWIVGVMPYVLLSLYFSTRVAARSRWNLLPLFPVIFAIIHIAWGIGFWIGIVNGSKLEAKAH